MGTADRAHGCHRWDGDRGIDYGGRAGARSPSGEGKGGWRSHRSFGDRGEIDRCSTRILLRATGDGSLAARGGGKGKGEGRDAACGRATAGTAGAYRGGFGDWAVSGETRRGAASRRVASA